MLHLVYEGEQPRRWSTSRPASAPSFRSQHEVWFDPEAGFRQTETFDGAVQFDAVVGPDEMSEHTTSIYPAWAPPRGLGQAGRGGREETVDGTGVY